MSDTPCIQCGLPSGTPPRLNHLANGLPCPICRDRLLESLPAPFPGQEPAEEVEETYGGFEPRYLPGESDLDDEPA